MMEEVEIDVTTGVGSVIYSGGKITPGTGLKINVVGEAGGGTVSVVRGPNLSTTQLPTQGADTPYGQYYKTWVEFSNVSDIDVPDDGDYHVIVAIDCNYNATEHQWEVGGGSTGIQVVSTLPPAFQAEFPFCYVQLGIVTTESGQIKRINQEVGNFIANPTPGGAGVPFAQVRSFDYQKSAANLPVDGPVGIYRTGMVMFFATGDSYIDFERINGTGIDWIPLIDGTNIGAPGSGAEGAYDKAYNLYVQQWQSQTDANFTIEGGRGASADADWHANKHGTFNNCPTLARCTAIIKL